MVITTQDTNASIIHNHDAFLVLPCPSSSLLAGLPLPRTGKRGVPQQFPRRLYEMLDGETALSNHHHDIDDNDTSNTHHHLIEWSASGKAFRIRNVEAFASTVLPKYFRTKKFSSFQRNLNLYGFTKVRRGVDTDMYAHPGFCRDAPEGLLKLRKITSTTSSSSVHGKNHNVRRRAVSPTTAASNLSGVDGPTPMIAIHHATMTTATMVSHPSSPVANTTTTTTQVAAAPPVSSKTITDYNAATTTTFHADSCGSINSNNNNNNNDWGKLDLLAMAMEQEFAKQYQQQQSSSSSSMSRPW